MLRRSILAFAALVLCIATPAARAGGINLSWDDCGAFGVEQKNFACDTNTGGSTLVTSAIPPVPMPQLNGATLVIDLRTNQATLSNWWHFETGGCRNGSLFANFNFTSIIPLNCMDPWQGQAAGGMTAIAAYLGPNSLRIRTICAIPGTVSVNDHDELRITDVVIQNFKTVGGCAGCSDGACIVLQAIQLYQAYPSGFGDYFAGGPILRQYVTWQPGGASVNGGCPQGVIPTRNATWGSIKSMYR